MKFLGISIYAAALLAYSQGVPNNWKNHGNKWRHKDVEEIHYQVITNKPTTTNETITAAPTSGVSRLAEDDIDCSVMSDSVLGEEILHFNGIFFGDFTTGGTGQDILGPLAVGGNFYAPNYVVNANHQVDCNADEKTSFDSIGLVVGGDSTTSGTHVRGDDLIAGDGDESQFDQQLPGCRVITDEGTGYFDFPQSIQEANNLSRRLAALSANRVLNEGGVVTTVSGSDDSRYKVFQFNTCDSGSCGTSTPEEIFFGNGNWNGPSGDVPSDSDTVIFNVPVTAGSTITLSTNAPTHGFNSCNAIYNFYPVDENGDYYPDGEFTINRETGSQFEGLVIAPRAHIRDGNTGNFAGTVIGNDYNWLDPSAGVEIHDWAAAGCPNFGGCIPPPKVVPTPTDVVPSPTDVVPDPTDSIPISPIPDTITPDTNTPDTNTPEPTETMYVVVEEKEWGHHYDKGKGKGKKKGGYKGKGWEDHEKHHYKGHSRDDKW